MNICQPWTNTIPAPLPPPAQMYRTNEVQDRLRKGTWLAIAGRPAWEDSKVQSGVGVLSSYISHQTSFTVSERFIFGFKIGELGHQVDGPR